MAQRCEKVGHPWTVVMSYIGNFSREPGGTLLFLELDQVQLIGLRLNYRNVLRGEGKCAVWWGKECWDGLFLEPL